MAHPDANDEFSRIERFLAPLAAGYPGALGLKDDAALVEVPDGHVIVATADAIVEGVHYIASDPPDLVARKLLRVNLSDLAAKGATPLGYLLTTALPVALDSGWLERFAQGLAVDQATFGLSLLGGDSVSTPGPVHLSVTALGTVPRGRAVLRSGARIGDGVFVSGPIGDGVLGLRAAKGDLPGIADDMQAYLADRYRLPQPRLSLGQVLRDLATAALDVSDGLIADLGHLARASGTGLLVRAGDVPVSRAGACVLRAGQATFAELLTGGDDYELAFTASPPAWAPLAAAGAVLIGMVDRDEGVRVVRPNGTLLKLDRTGYRHF